ncbi:hypothetical protein GF402_10560 [Candidatus Fermentibacteria bacterium]|nr:hypothetical protein [Candidatus Fermentibacteria bacterium]
MIVLLGAAATVSPEAFLDSLCRSGTTEERIELWVGTAHPDVDPSIAHPESLARFLESCTDLEVDPGERMLDVGDESSNRYTVVFPRSEWTWRAGDGRICRKLGPSVIEWREGKLYWKKLPVASDGRGVSVTNSERLMAAMMFTGLILLFGALLIFWVKRRWAS